MFDIIIHCFEWLKFFYQICLYFNFTLHMYLVCLYIHRHFTRLIQPSSFTCSPKRRGGEQLYVVNQFSICKSKYEKCLLREKDGGRGSCSPFPLFMFRAWNILPMFKLVSFFPKKKLFLEFFFIKTFFFVFCLI